MERDGVKGSQLADLYSNTSGPAMLTSGGGPLLRPLKLELHVNINEHAILLMGIVLILLRLWGSKRGLSIQTT